MARTDPYYSRENLKIRMNIRDDREDPVLDGILLAVSRQIDRMTGQYFYQTDPGTVRYVTPEYGDLLALGPFVEISEVAVDAYGAGEYLSISIPTVADYDPPDASIDGRPYTAILPVSFRPYWIPGALRAVRVTGTFGWPEIPAPIAEACAIQAQRLFQRRTAPLGVIAGGEIEQSSRIMGVDPDVARLVAGYRVLTV